MYSVYLLFPMQSKTKWVKIYTSLALDSCQNFIKNQTKSIAGFREIPEDHFTILQSSEKILTEEEALAISGGSLYRFKTN